MRAANDDEPMSFGRMPTDPDELERLHAWLLVELAEDDVDHVPIMLDVRLLRGRIDQVRPPERIPPRLTLVR